MKEIAEQLSDCRRRIDALDKQIQQLILERATLAKTIGAIKQKNPDSAYYRPEREVNVLREIMQRDCAPLQPQQMAHIFRTIMSACLALQKPMRIAFLGPAGTFSEQAALLHFGPALIADSAGTIPEVFQKVENNQADYGVVPVENSSTGLINISLDQFIQSPLKICGEVKIRIEHCLLRHPEQAASALETIYSHQQTLLQCQHWLTKYYPQAAQMPCDSNAAAAQKARENPNSAAIAGSLCAEKYKLDIIARGIQDDPNNYTRFVVIGRHAPAASGHDKTTLLVTVNDTPGALGCLINPLAKHHLNLTMIRSRPALDQENTHLFFLDIDGHQQQENFQQALETLRQAPLIIKILGSYPKAVI